MTRFLLLLLAVLYWPASHGADAQGAFSIRGAGLLSCETYVKERVKQSKAYYMIGGWLDGYITGVNQYAPETFDATSFENAELLALLLQEHCKDHHDDRLFSVVNSLLIKLQDDRLRTPSAQISVKVGTRETILYEEVLRRLQLKLQEGGYYRGELEPQFGEKTQAALAAFQRKNKLPATGFPDQTTLWHLLRQPTKTK